MTSALIALLISVAAACALVFAYGAAFFDWYLILFTINAFLIFQYGVRWLRGRMDAFDPAGLLGLFGLVYFLISPGLQIGEDFWPFIPPLTEDKGWITLWAALNLAGLVAYIFTLETWKTQPSTRTALVIVPSRFYWVCAIALALCLAMQIVVFFQFGGISGFIATFTERQQLGLGMSTDDPFENFGLPLLLAESFKYVFAMLCIYHLRDKPYARSLWFFLALMTVFLAVFLIFGGLRGSRSSTVFSLFFAAGMYHFWIKRISIRTIVLGIALGVSFVNGYYWYKIAGTEGLAAIFDRQARLDYAAGRQDSSLFVVTRDFGRMDVQTLALARYGEEPVHYSWGLTYATGIFTVTPKSIIPYHPPYLLEAKTNVVFGPGRFDPEAPRQTTILLGLFGEAFVNFGYLGIVPLFVVLGWLVARIRGYIRTLHRSDARWFILPAFCLLPLNFILSDFGLLIMLLTRNLLIPVIVLALSTRWVARVPARAAPRARVRSRLVARTV